MSESPRRALGARRDVPGAVARHTYREPVIRRVWRVASDVERLTGRTPDIADGAECCGLLRRQPSRRHESILERLRRLDALDDARDLGGELRRVLAHRARVARVEVACHTSWEDAIHHEAVLERRVARAYPFFLEPRELVLRERKPDVIADRPDVAEMVRDALALGHDGA